MIKKLLILQSIMLLGLGQACSGDGDGISDAGPDTVKSPGSEGGACYPNGTCNTDLTCLSKLCVRLRDLGPDVAKKIDAGTSDAQGQGDLSPKPDSKPWPCKNAGQCDDKLACTTDTCELSGCKYTLQSGRCLIAKVCYKSGDKAPQNPCQRCDPAKSTTSFFTSMDPGCVSTLAGSGAPGFQDGAAATAKFNYPAGLFRASSGTLYIADRNNHRIRSMNSWTVTTVAGSGIQGYQDGPVATARFNEPSAVAVDPAGVIYVAERGGQRIRTIAGGVVSTLAGSGLKGFLDGGALMAKFNIPSGIAVDASGQVYVGDKSNNRIRLVASGQVSTYAGSGAAGHLDGPLATAHFKSLGGIWLQGNNALYVADTNNNRIRLISGAAVSTLAGDGAPGLVNGAAATARFNGPAAIAMDSAGKLHVADRKNHVIRSIVGGTVLTLAGSGNQGFADGPLLKARFNFPNALAVDSGGKVYVADSSNHRIRLITP